MRNILLAISRFIVRRFGTEPLLADMQANDAACLELLKRIEARDIPLDQLVAEGLPPANGTGGQEPRFTSAQGPATGVALMVANRVVWSLRALLLSRDYMAGSVRPYIEIHLPGDDGAGGHDIIVTVQRCAQRSPHQFRREAEAESLILAHNLENYGDHQPGCDRNSLTGPYTCACGFRAALKHARHVIDTYTAKLPANTENPKPRMDTDGHGSAKRQPLTPDPSSLSPSPAVIAEH